MFVPRLFGWEEVDVETYSHCYQAFGGGVVQHPMVLRHVAKIGFRDTRYFCKSSRNGEVVAALPCWGHYLAGDKDAMVHFGVDRVIDLGTPEVLLPFAASVRLWLPFHTKYLSAENVAHVRNRTAFNRGRSLCMGKGLGTQGYSARTKQKRRNELKKFLAAGGQVHSVEEFSDLDLAELYASLFFKRWGRHHPQRASLPMMMHELRPLLAGHVLSIDNQPCAFQLLLTSLTSRYYAVEYVNGGVDPAQHGLSPGTVVTWLNINQAWQRATDAGVEMRYSFGRNSAGYKELWGNESLLYRVVAP